MVPEYRKVADQFVAKREELLSSYYPPEPEQNCISTNFLYARTIHCPYCDGLIPLSPNWKLSSEGTGVRLLPEKAAGPLTQGRVCRFEIVGTIASHSEGTVSDGDATCPYPDCARVVDGDEVKRQAQAGSMNEQLYAVVFKRKIVKGRTRAGVEKVKWVKGFRAPRNEDNNCAVVAKKLGMKLSEWEASDIVPIEGSPRRK